MLLKQIDTRIELINKMATSKIEIKIEDKVLNTNESLGTKIMILIPVKNGIIMRAIIVDDELNARLALKGILEENFS